MMNADAADLRKDTRLISKWHLRYIVGRQAYLYTRDQLRVMRWRINKSSIWSKPGLNMILSTYSPFKSRILSGYYISGISKDISQI